MTTNYNQSDFAELARDAKIKVRIANNGKVKFGEWFIQITEIGTRFVLPFIDDIGNSDYYSIVL